MPRKVAETDPYKQIDDYTGSGFLPFIFVKEEWKPGDKIGLRTKNPKYKPRSDPPSAWPGPRSPRSTGSNAGGDVPTPAETMMNALLKGEIDIIELPQHDLLKVMDADRNIKLVNLNKWGNQYIFRFNELFKPFDNAKIRQAVLYAFNQKDFRRRDRRCQVLQDVQGDVHVRTRRSPAPRGFEDKFDSNFAKAKALLKEGGYDGTPVVADAVDRRSACWPTRRRSPRR